MLRTLHFLHQLDRLVIFVVVRITVQRLDSACDSPPFEKISISQPILSSFHDP